jgi:hypothetical protein
MIGLVSFRFSWEATVWSLPHTNKFTIKTGSIDSLLLTNHDAIFADRYASYLDIHLDIDSEGRLRTKHYDKRDDFNFPIVNFPFICSNIRAAPAYGVYISQLIRYKLNGIDAINEITKPRIIWWKDIIYIAEREIKWSG